MAKLANVQIHFCNLIFVLVSGHRFFMLTINQKSVFMDAVGIRSSKTATSEVELNMHVPGSISLLVRAINELSSVSVLCWKQG